MKETAVSASDAEIREMLESVYRDFNARNINAILRRMADDVAWPNGWEGGYVHGHDGVRDYWSRQWAQVDPTVTPVDFASLPDGRIDVTVHQVVQDRDGAVLSDATVHHVYRLERGQIMHMEISE
jgi:ketosteroid isomerase-like protein